jgi:putative hydrolase
MEKKELSKFFGDYHTHTKYSDGSNTSADILKMARKEGYKEIAITDHGCGNKVMGLTMEKIDKLHSEIVALRQQYPEIKIYQGYEADIMGFDGTVDLNDELISKFDIILIGFHPFVSPNSFKEKFNFVLGNGLFCKVLGYTKKRIDKNTDALIKALTNYPIDIVAHLNHHMKVDSKRIGTFCAENGIYIEINYKHLRNMKEIINDLLPTNCMFIANTDCHDVKKVNNMDKIYDFIVENDIPFDRVANLGKIPVFKKK